MMAMKNGVFWDVTPCGCCKNRHFGELGASFIRVTRIGELGTNLGVTSNRRTLRRNTVKYQVVFFRSVRRLLVTPSVVPSSPILVTLIMEALRSYETSVLTRATRRNIPDDVSLQKYKKVSRNEPKKHRYNFQRYTKSYTCIERIPTCCFFSHISKRMWRFVKKYDNNDSSPS
jgi:hypothetical protein